MERKVVMVLSIRPARRTLLCTAMGALACASGRRGRSSPCASARLCPSLAKSLGGPSTAIVRILNKPERGAERVTVKLRRDAPAIIAPERAAQVSAPVFSLDALSSSRPVARFGVNVCLPVSSRPASHARANFNHHNPRPFSKFHLPRLFERPRLKRIAREDCRASPKRT